MHIIVKGPGLPAGDVMWSETLLVEIDGREFKVEDWSTRSGGGQEWYDPETDEPVEQPGELIEEIDAVEEARQAYWAAYQTARAELGIEQLDEEAHTRAAAAVAGGVWVKRDHRFWVIGEKVGLVLATDDEARAGQAAVVACVKTGRSVYVHDRTTEESAYGNAKPRYTSEVA